jgi:hypothetical protein
MSSTYHKRTYTEDDTISHYEVKMYLWRHHGSGTASLYINDGSRGQVIHLGEHGLKALSEIIDECRRDDLRIKEIVNEEDLKFINKTR